MQMTRVTVARHVQVPKLVLKAINDVRSPSSIRKASRTTERGDCTSSSESLVEVREQRLNTWHASSVATRSAGPRSWIFERSFHLADTLIVPLLV